MIESIPVTHAMTYVQNILREEDLPEELLNDFRIAIDSETGWNRDDFDVEVIFHNGPRYSFSVYGSMGNLEEQFADGLRTAVITLTRYVPKMHFSPEQVYFMPRKRIKILNSRFRPTPYFKPTWER